MQKKGGERLLTLVWGRETTLLDHLILVLDKELDSLDGGSGSLGDSSGYTTLLTKRDEVESQGSINYSWAGMKLRKKGAKKKKGRKIKGKRIYIVGKLTIMKSLL